MNKETCQPFDKLSTVSAVLDCSVQKKSWNPKVDFKILRSMGIVNFFLMRKLLDIGVVLSKTAGYNVSFLYLVLWTQ